MSESASTYQNSETPPEPEDEGMRDELIAAEKDRKAKAAQDYEDRCADAKLRYLGVNQLGDAPGSALADRSEPAPTEDEPEPEPAPA